eukprot:4461593-Amphidinium_carterae.1
MADNNISYIVLQEQHDACEAQVQVLLDSNMPGRVRRTTLPCMKNGDGVNINVHDNKFGHANHLDQLQLCTSGPLSYPHINTLLRRNVNGET